MDVLNTRAIAREKLPPGRQPKFTKEFMMLIGQKVVEDGVSFREAAKLFGCSHGMVSSAKKMFLTGQATINYSTPRSTKDSEICRLNDQAAKLKEQIGELYLENSLLKKALLYSQQLKKESSSVITSENLDQFQGDAE